MKSVLLWYLVMQLFALCAWPLAFRVCTRLHDRGYGLSKALGLLLVSYVTWILLFLPGVSSWAPFGLRTVAIGWGVVALVGMWTFIRNRHAMVAFVRSRMGLVLTYECVFAAAFALMLVFRGMVPHISYHIPDPLANGFTDMAAEKFTDFALLNSLLTSSSFPPHDAWLAPVPSMTESNGWRMGGWLNYYYFGHFLWAVLIKAIVIRPEVGFNLALAAAFALVCLQALSIGYNLTRRLRWGFLALFMVALASNVDGFLQLLSIVKVRVLDAPDGAWYLANAWYRNYDFWRSSRAVENTITEFPAFSFVLGDLHAHVSALVIFLLGLGLIVQAWRNVGAYRSVFSYQLHNLDELFFVALVAGALSAANSWDAITFIAVFAVALWAGNRPRVPRFAYEEPWRVPARSFVSGFSSLLLAVIVGCFGAVVLFLLFHKYFHDPLPGFPKREVLKDAFSEDGISGFLRALFLSGPLKLVQKVNRTDPFEFIAHWALLGLGPVILLATLFRRHYRQACAATTDARRRLWAWIAMAAAAACVLRPLLGSWTPILLMVCAALLLLALINHRQPPVMRLLLGLLFTFFVLTCFCELVYFDDIFAGDIERINTVFKIYYSLWPTMVVASILALRRLIRYAPQRLRSRRAFWIVLPVVVFGGAYPVVAPMQRVSQATRLGHWTPPEGISPEEAPNEMLRPAARARTVEDRLDGMRYLKYLHPDDYELIAWIRKHLPDNARLLEAAGTQYTYSGRVSTMTGRPSFAGWLYHGWGWRGDQFTEERIRRLQVAQEIYETTDTRTAYDLLLENGIEYVVAGDQERQQYVDMNENNFAELGTRVFRVNDTALYKIDYQAGPPRALEREPHQSTTDTAVDPGTEETTGSTTTESQEPRNPAEPEHTTETVTLREL
ncbi:MAG: DUF2298 domain-containing protein [Candidatus Sumerlaeaceae bacterium]